MVGPRLGTSHLGMGTRHLGTVDTSMGPRLLDFAATVPLRGKSCEGGRENLLMRDLGREPVYSDLEIKA